jgi:hypothetical protein
MALLAKEGMSESAGTSAAIVLPADRSAGTDSSGVSRTSDRTISSASGNGMNVFIAETAVA